MAGWCSRRAETASARTHTVLVEPKGASMDATSGLWAGTGRANITPPVGIAHAGWGAQLHERAEGVEQDLLATALVMANGAGLELAIVEIDTCILTNAQCDEMRA